MMQANRWVTAAAGVALGVVLTVGYIAWRDRPAAVAEDHAEEGDFPRGPHGGRLLHTEGLQVEMTIFETGVPPHFRVFVYDASDRPVPPQEVSLSVALTRLSGAVDRMTFVPEGAYLRSRETVEEPHSFEVKVDVRRGQQSASWTYAQEEGRATIPDAMLASSGIEVAAAGPGTIEPEITLPGEIAVLPESQIRVSSTVSGVIASLVPATGSYVRRGAIVAYVTSREVAEAGSAFLSALTRAEFAKVTRDREADLFKRRITAEQDYRASEQAYQQAELERTLTRQRLIAFGVDAGTVDRLSSAGPGALSRLPVRAPRDGIVTEVHTAQGQTVPADGPILTLTDTTRVWAEVQVHARDLPFIRSGQQVSVSAVDLPVTAMGRIVNVSTIVGDATRTATARIELPNPGGRWRPGLFVSAAVRTAPSQVAVAVPADALQTFRDWTVVFVRYGDVFEARPVETGRTDGRLVEIVSGLRSGERYAVKNAFAVKADVLKSGASHDH